DAGPSEAVVRLHPEQVLRGRLVDLQGQPAAGVKVYLAYVARKDPKLRDSVGVAEPREGLEPWPEAATTGAQGRFALRGLGRDLPVGLDVRAERFARQTLHAIETRDREGARELTQVLTPTQIIEGRITEADTGRPVPHAQLVVRGVDREFGKPTFEHGEVR